MIFDLSRRRRELTPDAPAVHHAGRWLTYQELDERATAAAQFLASLGVKRGERVSLLARNHPAHFDLLLGAPKLGYVHTPLNTRLKPTEQEALGAYLRPRVVIYGRGFKESGRAAAHAAKARAVTLDEYEAALTEPRPAALAPPELEPEDTQMILLTGGTTGTPKGAMLPYRQGFYNAVNTVLSWGLRDDDVVIQATPAFHAAVNALALPLLNVGAKVVIQEQFEPGEYLRLVREHGATILFLVPTMYRMLVEHEEFSTADFSTVRFAISGGAPSSAPVRAAFNERGVRFKQGYGLTEAGVNCFSITLDQAEVRPASVGKPVLHAEAAVIREDGTACSPGEAGELALKGPHVFTGYFERPEETALVLKDGWLLTGDLAVMDEEGFFTIVGRRKEMFVSGGENVFPAEVEAALYDHTAVSECAVAGIPDDRWGEVGFAAVTLRPGYSATPGELLDFLRERLANYKVPKVLRIVSELPKSGAGKILKGELGALAAAPEQAGSSEGVAS